VIKNSFLRNLVDMTVIEAQNECLEKGHSFKTYPNGTIIPSIAYGNTVLLFQENGKVASAQASDPLEVE
jgi:hypothetical protein